MISKEEFETYKDLTKKIEDTSWHVAEYLKEVYSSFEDTLKQETKSERFPLWEIGWDFQEEDQIRVFGGQSSFELKYLFLTDEEIRQKVDRIKEQKRLWKEARERMAQIDKEQREAEKQRYFEKCRNMTKEELLKELGIADD